MNYTNKKKRKREKKRMHNTRETVDATSCILWKPAPVQLCAVSRVHLPSLSFATGIRVCLLSGLAICLHRTSALVAKRSAIRWISSSLCRPSFYVRRKRKSAYNFRWVPQKHYLQMVERYMYFSFPLFLLISIFSFCFPPIWVVLQESSHTPKSNTANLKEKTKTR